MQVRALLEMARAVPRPKLLNGSRSSKSKAPRSPKRSNERAVLSSELEGDEHVDSSEVFRVPGPHSVSSRVVSPPSMGSRSTRSRSAPVSQVSVSTNDPEREGSTRIFMAPHLVPSSPTRRNASDDAVNQSMEESFTPDVSLTDKAPRGSVPIQKALSYDAEEECLISETGVESGHGKIHYPLSWTKAGIETSRGTGSPSRDIVVTRPYRKKENGAVSVVSQPESTSSSNKWGSETVNFSTGNKERDDVMSRAKAILDAHSDRPELQELHSSSWTGNESVDDVEWDDSRDANIVQSLSDSLCQEDGIAPLGGEWPRDKASKRYSRELLGDPMNHLHLIHEEASRRLSVSITQDCMKMEMLSTCI